MFARGGREPGAFRLSTTHGVVATGWVAGEREADLSAVHGRGFDGEDQSPCASGTKKPRASGRGHGAEPAVEHGLHARACGGWARVSDPDRRGPVHAG